MQVHLLEPQWKTSSVQQVVGRAVRATSHSLLPSKFEPKIPPANFDHLDEPTDDIKEQLPCSKCCPPCISNDVKTLMELNELTQAEAILHLQIYNNDFVEAAFNQFEPTAYRRAFALCQEDCPLKQSFYATQLTKSCS